MSTESYVKPVIVMIAALVIHFQIPGWILLNSGIYNTAPTVHTAMGPYRSGHYLITTGLAC